MFLVQSGHCAKAEPCDVRSRAAAAAADEDEDEDEEEEEEEDAAGALLHEGRGGWGRGLTDQ